jgi:hypothetical protein
MRRTVNATGPVWGEDDLRAYEAKLRATLVSSKWPDTRLPRRRRLRAAVPASSARFRVMTATLCGWRRRNPVDVSRTASACRRSRTVVEFALSNLLKARSLRSPGGGTTHFVVVDGEGTIVTMSQTIGHFFGSGVVVEGFGIVLNDDISDMERKPGHPNSVGPNKRSVANMAPTIVFRNGKPRLGAGDTGQLANIPGDGTGDRQGGVSRGWLLRRRSRRAESTGRRIASSLKATLPQTFGRGHGRNSTTP